MLAGCNFLNPDERTLQLLREQNLENFADVTPELLKATFIRAADSVFITR